jgi:hypothetical protein
VKDAVHANHGLTEALSIGDISEMKDDAECFEERGFLSRADERDHLVAAPDKLLREFAAEKSRRARDEVAWHRP